MTARPQSQCSTCARFRPPLANPDPDRWDDEPSCEAFPDGIPRPILHNTVDHRRAFEGDHGMQWLTDGHPFPEYALALAKPAQ